MAAGKQTKAMELWIGLAVIAGVLLVAGLIFVTGSPSGAFQKTYGVIVSLPHAGALRPGAPIQLGGIVIGRVREIGLNADATAVDLVCRVNHQIPLPVDSTAHVSTMGIVGDSFLEIRRGKSERLLPKFDEPDPVDSRIKAAAGGGITEAMATLSTVGENVNALIGNINDVLGQTEVRQSLKDIVVSLDQVTSNANTLIKKVQGVVDHVDASAAHLNQITDDVKSTTGDVRQTVARVRGTVDRLLDDENLDRVDDTIEAVDRTAKRVDRLLASIEPERVKDLVDKTGRAVDRIGALAERGDGLLAGIDQGKVNATIGQAGEVMEKMGHVMSRIDPGDVAEAVKSLRLSLAEVRELIAGVRRDVVLALAVNKAADRITEAKFREMKRGGIQDADGQLKEISTWINQGLRRGFLPDPSYPDPAQAPYRTDTTSE